MNRGYRSFVLEADQHRVQVAYLLTAYLFTAAGAWVFLIQPLFLGALTETYQLGPEQIGYLSAIEMTGAVVTSFSAPFWINRFNRRHIVVCGLCIASLGNVLSIYAEEFEMLLVARFFTSFLGSGIVYAVGISMLGDLKNPDRYFAIGLTVQVLIGSLALVVMPHLLSYGGSASMLAALAGLYLLVMPLQRWVAVRSLKLATTGDTAADKQAGFNRSVVLVLLSFVALNAASGAFWAFTERIGNNAQLSSTLIGTYLGAATLVGALGSFTASLLGTRFGRRLPLIAGFACYGVALVWINLPITGLSFALSVMLFNFAWNLIIPYQFGLLSENDATGRFMVLSVASQAGGLALGPLIAGQLIAPGEYVSVSHTSFVLMTLSMIALLTIAGRVKRGDSRHG